MKSLLITLTAIVFASNVLFAQMQTVQLNIKRLQFDDGKVLPAEKAFNIATDAPLSIGLVKLQVADNGFEKNKYLYETYWKRKDSDNSTTAMLTNHHKLRSNKGYDMRFIYYRKINELERNQIKLMLGNTAQTLLKSNIILDNKRYKFNMSPSDLMEALTNIVQDGMVNYETKAVEKIEKIFSGVIENTLRAMVKNTVVLDTAGKAQTDLMSVLTKQVQTEIEMLSNNYTYTIEDKVTVLDYKTEKTKNYLALNLGYGGVYNSGNFSDLSYFSAPYAGVSFPLGSKAFSSRFWQKASFSLGVFLNDFKETETKKFTGPIVKRPVYAAFGFKAFDLFKFHVGATALEEVNTLSAAKDVSLKPFIGLSLELNLWLGIGRN